MGAGAAAGAAGDGVGYIMWGIAGGMLTTGAGCCKASFFLIVSSQSDCFICSSTISLESTSLLMKMILIPNKNKASTFVLTGSHHPYTEIQDPLTYLTRSDTCFMKADIADASGIFVSGDSTFPSDDATWGLGSTAGVEFKGFSAVTLEL